MFGLFSKKKESVELRYSDTMEFIDAKTSDGISSATKKAKPLVDDIMNEIMKLRKQFDELKEIKSENKKLQDDIAVMSEQNKRLSKQGDGSQSLQNEIKQLQEANQALKQEMDQMQSVGQSSMLGNAVKWFLTGGGVLLLGLFLGRSVPRKNPYGY